MTGCLYWNAQLNHSLPEQNKSVLYTFLTHDCTSMHPSDITVKFSDDTVVAGFNLEVDEAAYRTMVAHLAEWYSDNNLLLRTSKRKEPQ